jgi:hypothetical protein
LSQKFQRKAKQETLLNKIFVAVFVVYLWMFLILFRVGWYALGFQDG